MKSLTVLLIVFVISSAISQSNDTIYNNAQKDTNLIAFQYLYGKSIYTYMTPNQFLDNLNNLDPVFKKLGFVFFPDSHQGWITKADVDTLIQRIYDTTRTVCIVSPRCSDFPFHKYSCIGREALNLIIAYKANKSYPNFLYSCGGIDSLKAKEIENWWKHNN